MIRFLKYSVALAAIVALALAHVRVEQAFAAATTQTTHAYLCYPVQPAQAPGGKRVVNTSSTTTPQPSYILNSAGCAVIASSDVGFFLSQGFYYGPNIFSTQQTGITANQTSSTSTLILPANAYVVAIIVEETAGNAVTGGVNIGDSGSAARFVSAGAVAANSTAAMTLVAGQTFGNTGVPAQDQILVVAVTSFNSASLNVNVLYSYF